MRIRLCFNSSKEMIDKEYLNIIMVHSFDPIIDSNCTILILGTMPGIQSLVKQEYYGNPQNTFWKIIFALFDDNFNEDYDTKRKFLLKNNIALWDVLKTCNREGSSDSNIKDPISNDFNTLFKEFPHLQTIYFNGGPAGKLFKKHFDKNGGILGLPCYYLPSTSPAYVAKYEDKLIKWQILLHDKSKITKYLPKTIGEHSIS